MKPYFEKVAMPDESFRIKSFFSEQFEHVIAVHPHWHPEVEILYIVDGHATQQVNEYYFTTEPGDIIIIGKDQLHSTYSYQNSQCRILVLMFDSSDLLRHGALQGNDRADEIFGNGVLFHNPIKTNSGPSKQLRDAILDVHEEMCGMKKGYKTMVRSLLYRIAGVLTREEVCKLEKSRGKDLSFIRQVLEKTFKLIDDCYSDDELSLKKAAEASHLSTPHFCRLFKKATGMTFSTYLTFYRVNRAEKMINSDKTLLSIALECGFGSASSFIRSFKKYKNCTPSACKRLRCD